MAKKKAQNNKEFYKDSKFWEQTGKVTLVVLAALTLISVIVFTFVYYKDYKAVKEEKAERDSVKVFNSDKYNTVYLDNNLFYFCKLVDFSEEYYECKDPYYLVRKEDENGEENLFVTKPELEEVAQPNGSYFINKDKVIYITEVGEDSSILEFIKEDK